MAMPFLQILLSSYVSKIQINGIHVKEEPSNKAEQGTELLSQDSQRSQLPPSPTPQAGFMCEPCTFFSFLASVSHLLVFLRPCKIYISSCWKPKPIVNKKNNTLKISAIHNISPFANYIIYSLPCDLCLMCSFLFVQMKETRAGKHSYCQGQGK